MSKTRAIIGYVLSDGTWNNSTPAFFVEVDSMNFTLDEAVDMFLVEQAKAGRTINRDEVCANPILEPVGDTKNPEEG